MRPTLGWVLTLTSGFTAFIALASLALLPMQAAKNRAVYRVVDQYAHQISASETLPRNAKVDDAFAATTGGIRVWRALPGGCQDVSFEASNDRFVLGFWENGSANRFGASWWRCYAYPSRNTTLKLSVTDYLTSGVGQQVAAYAFIAIITGYLALALHPRRNGKSLRTWTKAIWFGAFMTLVELFYVVQNSGDDEFFKSSEPIKWFVFVFENSIGVFSGLGPVASFFTWVIIAWVASRAVTFARSRLRPT